MTRTTFPTDPLFQHQWFLHAADPRIALTGQDLDLPRVWADYSGRGIKVAVVEPGNVQPDHPDLPTPAQSLRFTPAATPGALDSDDHATGVAGIIVARWNALGGAGIAPDATLHSFGWEGGATLASRAAALAAAREAGADVVNNSWGLQANNIRNNPDAADRPIIDELARLANFGRDGLGSIITWANGNDRQSGADGGLDGASASRHVIAVGAADNNGAVSVYSTPGANILVSAYGGASRPQATDRPGNGILTTDLTGSAGFNTRPDGDINHGFNGTSAAAPQVAGIAALMLQAHPGLGYRDVHAILAGTARVPEPGANQRDMQVGARDWNGGHRLYTTDLGFGIADAHGAVRVAEAMRATGWVARTEENLDMQLISGRAFGNSLTFRSSGEFLVERVELSLQGVAFNLGTTTLQLNVSGPYGIGQRLDLLEKPRAVLGQTLPEDGYTWQTPAFLGIQTAGTWQLHFENSLDRSDISSAVLRLFGRDRPAETMHWLTDDVGWLVDARGGSLSQFSTAPALINGAALSSGMVLDFNATTQMIAGRSLGSGHDLPFRDAWGGDGDDRFIGNASDNLFYGGRGDNTISGGDGVDTAAYLGSRALHNVFQTASGFTVQGRDGRDALDGIEVLRFDGGAVAAGDATDAALVAAALYRTLLGRAPDRAGFDAWQATLNEAVGRDAMGIVNAAQGFMGSVEFGALHGGLSDAGFVALLYQGFFGRPGDAAGAAHWEAVLGGGAARAELVRGFVLADEFQVVTMPRIMAEAGTWPL